MREIKFRAWGPNSKKIWNHEELKYCSLGWLSDQQAGEKIIMQFIGLHDKNGKEIYEGDILKWKCSHGSITGRGKVLLHTVTIQWGHLTSSHGYSLAIYKNGEKYATEKSFWNDDDREVIGNIYENPELINA